jgi:hypothetical protein
VNGKMFYPINIHLVQKYYSKLINSNDDVQKLFQLFKNKNTNLSKDKLKEQFNTLFNYLQYDESVMTKENFYLTNENNPIKVKLFYLTGYKNNYPELDYLGYLQGIQSPQDTELKIIFSGKYYSQDTNTLLSKIENNIYMSSIGLDDEQVAINFLLLHNLESASFSSGKNRETIIKITSDEVDSFELIEQKINTIPRTPIILQKDPLIRKVGRGGKKLTKKNYKKVKKRSVKNKL